MKSGSHKIELEYDIFCNFTTNFIGIRNPAAGSISVETLGDSQGNCLLLDKVTDADWIAIRDNLSYTEGPKTYGTVKFIFYKTNYAGFQFRLYDQFKAIAALAFYDGEVRSYSQAGWFYSDPYVLLTTYQTHQWYQVQIDFDVNLGYTFILNGEKYGSGYTIPLSESDPGTYTNTLAIISPVGIDSWDIGCEYDIIIIKIVNADNTQVYDYSEEFEIIGQEGLWVVLAIGGIAVVLAGSTTGIVLGIRHYRRRKHPEQVIKQNYETEVKRKK